ncbi:MAG: hypothetical protein MJ252_09855 [archaeon]|nr:hypothetical protein [archaeon]
MDSGHYYSYVKRGNNWYQCNDASVSSISERNALSENAYLLFFRKEM